MAEGVDDVGGRCEVSRLPQKKLLLIFLLFCRCVVFQDAGDDNFESDLTDTVYVHWIVVR